MSKLGRKSGSAGCLWRAVRSTFVCAALSCFALIAEPRPAEADPVAGPPPSAAGHPQPFMRGIALGRYAAISASALSTKLSEIKSIGADYVSIVVVWSTRDVRSTEIAPAAGRTTPDRTVREMIAKANALGLKTLLFPILDVQRRKPLEWRGTLKPARWDDWWENYRHFILHYAQLAAGGAALFCVGSELVSTEQMRERWADLIARVRDVYPGKLVYSANWDHYKPVRFWNLVDVVGLTAYYRIADDGNAPESTLHANWVRIRDRLVSWAKGIRRRIVFTEVGYPSLDGGAVHPWDYTSAAAVDPEEQRRAYRAFTRAWTGVDQLAGVFFWDWYGEGGLHDKRYTPRGKPAERVLRRWFGSRPTTARSAARP